MPTPSQCYCKPLWCASLPAPPLNRVTRAIVHTQPMWVLNICWSDAHSRQQEPLIGESLLKRALQLRNCGSALIKDHSTQKKLSFPTSHTMLPAQIDTSAEVSTLLLPRQLLRVRMVRSRSTFDLLARIAGRRRRRTRQRNLGFFLEAQCERCSRR